MSLWRRANVLVWLAAIVLPGSVLWTSTAAAQGVLVVVDPGQQVRLPRPPIIWPPHPPHPRPVPPPPAPAGYKIGELDVQARLVDQVAQVQVSQTFVNTGSTQLEVSFVFPLPYDGAIDQMTLLVDGKEYAAKLLSAEQARRFYEDIVRKNRDPALLEWIGTGLFRTSVFPVPAGARRTVSLRYTQLLRKQDGLTDFLFPMSTAKYTAEPVDRIHVRVSIESTEEIKNVYSPTHPVEITRPDERHAVAELTAENAIPGTDFRLLFDAGRGQLSAKVLSYRPSDSDDGYFLLLASPKISTPDTERPRKTVVFVVDRSGSMSGKKIEQVREALKFVLNNLREGDLFNIVAYDSDVEAFRPELQRFNDQTRKAALGFVEGIYAGGSTNIDAALGTALGQLVDSSRPSYVIFLTDGLPTAGVTDEMQIVDRASKANKVRARIMAFGVGYDVNSRLIDRLVRSNHGQSEYVRPDEDIEGRVGQLYKRIESPVLTDVYVEFQFDELRSEEGQPISRMYPACPFDLFAGEQLVIVGRYRKAGDAKVVVRGSIAGKEQQFTFPAKLVSRSDDGGTAFVEKLWAIRRVGEILDELDLKGKNEELVKELVGLATRHGILTPYTSFLADDRTDFRDMAASTRVAADRLLALDEAWGASGFRQRAMKGAMQSAAQAAPAMAMPAAPAAGGMGGGFGYGGPPALAEAAVGRAGATQMPGAAPMVSADEANEAQAAQQTVRHIADRVFYQRGGRWVDSQVTSEQEKKAQRVKQFSDAYFELVRRHDRQVTQFLVFDEPVVLLIDSQAYLVEP